MGGRNERKIGQRIYMKQWDWLTKPETPYTWGFFARVLIKGLILFALVNLFFAVVDPLPVLGKMSLYNVVVPGRTRLPYGENPDASYNLNVTNFDALFASHEIAGAKKADDEYRVLFVGDSSVWGVLLDSDKTLSALVNQQHLKLDNGKRVRAFNIGYPDQTLTKDVLLLQYAMQYQPDLVVWLVTLEAMPRDDQQVGSLLVRENAERVQNLVQTYQLTSVNPNNSKLTQRSFIAKTLIGQRRALADLLRNQLYGITSNLSGIDQKYPRFYEPRRENFDTEITWHGLKQSQLTANDLAFDVLNAGFKIAGNTPVILVNEPIFISAGTNSDLRYNFFYPRWAYDSYRKLLADTANTQHWTYADFWNLVPSHLFTDSAVHFQPEGSELLAARVSDLIVRTVNASN
jgi:hypothetical protein